MRPSYFGYSRDARAVSDTLATSAMRLRGDLDAADPRSGIPDSSEGRAD